MDENASLILASPGFLSLSQAAILQLISRDSFFAKEVEIFRAVVSWCEANRDSQRQEASGFAEVLNTVRLPLLGMEDIFAVVRPSKLVDPERLLDAIQTQVQKKSGDLHARGRLGEKKAERRNDPLHNLTPIISNDNPDWYPSCNCFDCSFLMPTLRCHPFLLLATAHQQLFSGHSQFWWIRWGAEYLNLFPPNVPVWEHDLKDNFLGFSFEQFFSKLVPHLEQMFSPLSVKKYNFWSFR